MTLICRNSGSDKWLKTIILHNLILKQVECMLSQQERVAVISKSNVSYILSFFSGTSSSQALAADDSMEQQTIVIPEGISRGELSKFGSGKSLHVTTWL